MKTLKSGSSGNEVLKLQKSLNKYFLSKYGIKTKFKVVEDGEFGPGTKKAVEQFQAETTIKSDGIVGAATWAKLIYFSTVLSEPATSTTSTSTIEFTASENERFVRITGLVIENLEGGYYHPNMNSPHGKLKKHYSYLDSSGETMFGIDRLNGKGDLSNNPSWNKFWGIIDTAGASSKWDYNFKGGTFKDELSKYAIEIMGAHFLKLSKTYLKENWKVIAKDNRQMFHFAYAAWNGAGWFKKFANDINKAIQAGNTDSDFLAQVALNSRMKEGLKPGSPPNKLLVQTGEKIRTIFKTLK